MNNIYTFKSYFSKADEHLSFEFYYVKECLKFSTQLLVNPTPDSLYGLLAGAQQGPLHAANKGMNIIELLDCIEDEEQIIIENKASLIAEASQYIRLYINPRAVINYAVFDHLRYFTAATFTHSMIRDLCDNKIIVNIAGLKQSLADIDEASLFQQVKQDYQVNQNRIIHADELVSLL